MAMARNRLRTEVPIPYILGLFFVFFRPKFQGISPENMVSTMIWSNIFQHIPKMFHHLNGNYWNYIVLGLYLLLFVGILKSGIFHKLWNICIGFNIFMGIYLLDS